MLDANGVVDRRRVVVGGHSYGAFMTANLLAHTDLFAAGIARSGAYNRTLTPRYVVLPNEAHGYRARESVLDTLAEMIEWADRWAKNRPAPATP